MRHVKHVFFILMCMGTTLFQFLFSATLSAQEASNPGLHLKKVAICRNIVNRAPHGSGSVFPAGIGRLYCFTKVVGAKTDTAVIHHWYVNGKLKASVTLPVKSASWRTWSKKDIAPNETGDWMVEVLTEDGDAMESILFFVN